MTKESLLLTWATATLAVVILGILGQWLIISPIEDERHEANHKIQKEIVVQDKIISEHRSKLYKLSQSSDLQYLAEELSSYKLLYKQRHQQLLELIASDKRFTLSSLTASYQAGKYQYSVVLNNIRKSDVWQIIEEIEKQPYVKLANNIVWDESEQGQLRLDIQLVSFFVIAGELTGDD